MHTQIVHGVQVCAKCCGYGKGHGSSCLEGVGHFRQREQQQQKLGEDSSVLSHHPGPVTAEGSPRGTKDLLHRRHQQGLSVTEKEAGEYSLVRAENIFKYIFWMEEAAYRGE